MRRLESVMGVESACGRQRVLKEGERVCGRGECERTGVGERGGM